MPNRHLALVALLVLALSACERKPKGDPKGPSKDPEVTLTDKVTVKVAGQGSGDAKLIRYAFKAPRKLTAEIEVRTHMAMEMDGRKQPETPMPPFRMVMEIDAQSVSPAGDLTYAFLVKSADVVVVPEVPERLTQAMQQGVKLAEGMAGTATVGPDGVTKKAEFKLPPSLPPQLGQMIDTMQQQMHQLSAQLPAEPVSVGATWDVSMPVKSKFLKIGQAIRYQLLEREGDRVKLQATFTQRAPAQTMQIPGAPPNAALKLKEMRGTGSGTMTLDLTSPVAAAEFELSTTMAATIPTPGGEKEMRNHMRVKVRVTPR